jgi:alpha-tubulin suppressor-like RCC1 family protein
MGFEGEVSRGWGDNSGYQLGNGVNLGGNTNLPTLVQGISNVIAIAAGDYHAIAITADKRLWTWGYDNQGQLGRNDNASDRDQSPGQVTNLPAIVSIAGGVQFTLAVTSNGQVYAWGSNGANQLGTTNIMSTTNPVLVAGITNAVLVAASPDGTHSLAMTVDQGTNHFWGWGNSTDGQVGSGDIGDDMTVPAQLHFLHQCGPCFQMGTNGTLHAMSTGTLVLFFNDGTTSGAYSDNGGSYTVSLTDFSTVIVPGTSTNGVIVGAVTNGGAYAYSASGTCNWSPGSPQATPEGNDASDNTPFNCDQVSGPDLLCTNCNCFSLVGKIE